MARFVLSSPSERCHTSPRPRSPAPTPTSVPWTASSPSPAPDPPQRTLHREVREGHLENSKFLKVAFTNFPCLSWTLNARHEVREWWTRVVGTLDTPKAQPSRRVQHCNTSCPPFPQPVSTTPTSRVPRPPRTLENMPSRK